jgi:hypothetical protein
VVLIANAVIGVADVIQRDFAVVMRQRNEFAARMLFRRAAFVGINVGILAAEHRVVRSSQRLKPEDIGAGSVEGEENVNIRAEMFVKFLDSRTGIGVVAISHDVALVYPGKGLKDFRVHSGIVVAGKAAPGLNWDRFHPKQCSRVGKGMTCTQTQFCYANPFSHPFMQRRKTEKFVPVLRLSSPADNLSGGTKRLTRLFVQRMVILRKSKFGVEY